MAEWINLKMARPGVGKAVYLPAPTRKDVRAAAALLLRCNDVDLDEWTGGLWSNVDAREALRALVLLDTAENVPSDVVAQSAAS